MYLTAENCYSCIYEMNIYYQNETKIPGFIPLNCIYCIYNESPELSRVLLYIKFKLLKVTSGKKKSHTYEEGGAHLRISFWHLLMNLKNKSLLKKLLKWANKKQNNFNVYNVAFF